MQWMQYTVDAVRIGHSGIVIYRWWGHCLWGKKVKPVEAMDAVHSGHSGIVVYGTGDIVFGAKRSNQWIEWMQYAVDTVRSGCSM